MLAEPKTARVGFSNSFVQIWWDRVGYISLLLPVHFYSLLISKYKIVANRVEIIITPP